MADFLIGRDEDHETDARFTLPGDSGTIWHLDLDAEVSKREQSDDEDIREFNVEAGM